MLERWNTGILGLYYIALKNIMIHEINQSWIEKTLLQTLMLYVFDHYSSIPAFHYSK
jgi:hypothetical protein